MKFEIPEPLVYFGAGVMVDRAVRSIFGNSLSDIAENVLYKISEAQRLRKIENRRVVDVCGDTLGYFDIEYNIVKGELNE